MSAANAEAQRWFDLGLNWTYGFNHEEAILCFQEALKHDPNCAMAHWGVANAIGPNYNREWRTFTKDELTEAIDIGRASIEAARNVAKTPLETALCDALATRFPLSCDVEDFAPFNDAYADAMRRVCRDTPSDLDIVALCAEAMMNRTPWKLWSLKEARPAEGADTEEIVALLDNAFATLPGAWDHPALLHLYVHVMEMSPHPERGLRHGDRLLRLQPDGGHLIHMASHLDVLCGDYQAVVERNQAAVVADRKFVAERGPANFYTLYRVHNLHFVIYGAMFLGQPEPALEAAREIVDTMPLDLISALPDYLEAYTPMRLHVLVRFGMWEAILDDALPEDPELFCFSTALGRYARTVALANLGRLSEAETEYALFTNAVEQVPESRLLFNNICLDILMIAEHMALGELLYHQGRYDEAFEALRQAVERDDNLPYDEPWGWMHPARHAFGALLLEQDRLEEAEAIYRADLGLDPSLARACQHPDNIWSLHGLMECLERSGDGGSPEATLLRQKLDKAAARASVSVRSSCFCRKRNRAA